MAKERVEKSGIIVGLNKGHVSVLPFSSCAASKDQGDLELGLTSSPTKPWLSATATWNLSFHAALCLSISSQVESELQLIILSNRKSPPSPRNRASPAQRATYRSALPLSARLSKRSLASPLTRDVSSNCWEIARTRERGNSRRSGWVLTTFIFRYGLGARNLVC